MRIGKLSAATACSVEAIRYYEKEGLMPIAARSLGNYRIYGATHMARLIFIRRCRSLDMSLEEIRELLRLQESAVADCVGIDAVIEQHLRHVSLRITELQGLEKQLSELLAKCSTPGGIKDCGVLKGLIAGDSEERAVGHVKRTHR